MISANSLLKNNLQKVTYTVLRYQTSQAVKGLESKSVNNAESWLLHGAVCIQRYPTLIRSRTTIEDEYHALLEKKELQRSVMSDHELKLKADEKMLAVKRAAVKDKKGVVQKVITTKDIDEQWENERKSLQLSPRNTGTTKKTETTRILDETLILLVKQKVGNKASWRLPTMQHLGNVPESIRETAERAVTLLGKDFVAHIKSNSPDGFFKHPLTQTLTENASPQGVKTFVFKAEYQEGTVKSSEEIESYVWVPKAELKDYLTNDKLTRLVRDIVMDIY